MRRLRLRRQRLHRRSTRCSGPSRTWTGWSPRPHRRGLRVLLDWVPNHTSDRHPGSWRRARRRDDPRRDWYVWRDPARTAARRATGSRYVGDSAWCWHERTGQYYYRVFLDAQPDLNWRNPEVQEAMFDTLRFWLARGDRRVPDRRPVAAGRGRPAARQPAQPRLPARRGLPLHARAVGLDTYDRPETRELAADPQGGRRVRRRPGAAGRAGGAAGADRGLLRRRRRRDPGAVQLRAALRRLGRPGHRRLRRPLPGRAARPGPGPTGCSATTTPRGWPPGSARPRPGWRPCCCSPCPAPPSSTTATRSAWATCRSRRRTSWTRSPTLIPGRGRDPERIPMPWDDRPGGGFTSGTPWLPLGEDNRP